METGNKLPSSKQINEKVKLSFAEAGELSNATVINVKFTESKVFYDVELIVKTEEEKQYTTRIYNIDSSFVTTSDL